MENAKVYLIPNFLGAETSIERSIPTENIVIIKSLDAFAVEHLKDSRRFLVRIGLKERIDQSTFFDLNKKSTPEEIDAIISHLKKGNSVGIISDAGCPGIADPGAKLVAQAHRNNIPVVPLIGPSSILLALMASGFNGQSFAFSGYLNREKHLRIKEIKELEQKAKRAQQTQLFMETPYRNDALWQDLMQNLQPSTKLCIAMNISLTNEYIKSNTVANWKKLKTSKFNKLPAIFILSA